MPDVLKLYWALCALGRKEDAERLRRVAGEARGGDPGAVRRLEETAAELQWALRALGSTDEARRLREAALAPRPGAPEGRGRAGPAQAGQGIAPSAAGSRFAPAAATPGRGAAVARLRRIAAAAAAAARRLADLVARGAVAAAAAARRLADLVARGAVPAAAAARRLAARVAAGVAAAAAALAGRWPAPGRRRRLAALGLALAALGAIAALGAWRREAVAGRWAQGREYLAGQWRAAADWAGRAAVALGPAPAQPPPERPAAREPAPKERGSRARAARPGAAPQARGAAAAAEPARAAPGREGARQFDPGARVLLSRAESWRMSVDDVLRTFPGATRAAAEPGADGLAAGATAESVVVAGQPWSARFLFDAGGHLAAVRLRPVGRGSRAKRASEQLVAGLAAEYGPPRVEGKGDARATWSTAGGVAELADEEVDPKMRRVLFLDLETGDLRSMAEREVTLTLRPPAVGSP